MLWERSFSRACATRCATSWCSGPEGTERPSRRRDLRVPAPPERDQMKVWMVSDRLIACRVMRTTRDMRLRVVGYWLGITLAQLHLLLPPVNASTLEYVPVNDVIEPELRI